MNRTSTTLTFVVAVVMVCLVDLALSEKHTLHRQKRGFRQDAASRVAHGYGKRGDLLLSSSHLQQFPSRTIDSFSGTEDDGIDRPNVSTNEMEKVLFRHPSLARLLLLRRYDTNDGDDLLSPELLSRHGLRK